MCFLRHVSLLATVLVSYVFADLNYLRNSELCASGCGVALFSVSFDGKPAAAKSGVMANPMACVEPLWAQSLFYCSTVYCQPEHLQRALAAQNLSCESYTGMSLPPYSAPNPQNVTMVSQMQAMSMMYNKPVVPNQQFYELGYRSSEYLNYAQKTNWDFVWGLYGFWGLVLLVGIANRILHRSRRFAPSQSDLIESESPSAAQRNTSPLQRSNSWIHRHLVVPFAFGSKKWIPSGYSSMPTRLETFLIVIYVVLNFVFCFPGYHLFSMDILLPETKQQLAKYLANRFGSLAVGNIPVVWLFAARNDPLLWLTGWSYATYSQFHRWSARILFVLVISHATANSVLATYSGKEAYYSLFQQVFVQWALVVILSFSILVGTSIYAVRNHIYDLWLVTHFVFAMVALIGVFYHTKEVNGRYNGFLWFAVAIWAFDRLLRLLRLILNNFSPSTKTTATAHYDPQSDIVRLDVTPHFTSRRSSPQTGAYYFIYEPLRLKFWESHPFSLCAWPELTTPASISPARALSAQTSASDEKPASLNSSSLSNPNPGASSVKSSAMKYTFLIKPRAGFTKHLRHRYSTPEPHPIKVLVEGPYGPDFNLKAYPNVVMFIGGSGITSVISRIHELLSTSHTRVKLIWAVRELALAEDVVAKELGSAVGNKSFEMEVHLTKGDNSKRAEGKCSEVIREVRSGRPDLTEILRREREGCGGEALGVMVCGPPGFEEEGRKAAAIVMGENGGKIGFFGERFGW